MILNILKNSLGLFKPVVKNSILVLSISFIGGEFLQHYYTQILALTKAAGSINIFAVVNQALVSLLEFVILTMLVPLRVMEHQSNKNEPPASFWAFAKKHTPALTLESIRALAVTLLWSLLLILPGVFKYVRLFFVPYVVVADPEYQSGNRDALEYSNKLIKGIGLPLFLLILALFGIDLLRSSVRESFPLFTNPIPAGGLALGFFIFNIYINILLFRLYQERVKELARGGTPNGTHV